MLCISNVADIKSLTAMKTLNNNYNLNVTYNENQGIWTVTIGTRSKTVYSLDDVLHHITVYQTGLSNLLQ